MPIFSDKTKKKVYLRKKSLRLQGIAMGCTAAFGIFSLIN